VSFSRLQLEKFHVNFVILAWHRLELAFGLFPAGEGGEIKVKTNEKMENQENFECEGN
jgi:hypothetical protein